ncbi:MAG: S9 family peptidase [Chloroflexota bacterium]|nr:S9 family peptidase [Chloroflexota bacterium]
MTTQVAPYGSWKSPITSDLIVAGTVSLSQIAFDGDDVYWIEQRPAEAGRNVIVRRTPEGKTIDMTPPPFNARTRVHEYGGGAYMVDRGTIYFSNFADQRLYRQNPGAAPQPLTPAVDLRYADGVIDRRRNRMIVVREDHTADGQEAVNTLVSISLDGDNAGGTVLIRSNNFYSSPRLSPGGTRLAWLTWNHPNMPWDGTELWVGNIDANGAVTAPTRVAGGVAESIFQPEWSPDGVLYFISDKTGWWNLYRWRSQGEIEPLCAMDAEFGTPQWVFGLSTYAFESSQRIICSYEQAGDVHLARLDLTARRLEEMETPYQEIAYVRALPGRVVFWAGAPTTFPAIVQLDLATRRIDVLRHSSDLQIDPGYCSTPQAIEFPTENHQAAYAFFYPPRNSDFAAPAGEKPPLLVFSHGGPTGATSSTLQLGIQYWTSHGFAVADVNYGGSSGYGRAYRQRLNGQWGVVDLNDCANAARYLVQRGLVDGKRLAIRGGSAGGYTTLAALTFTDVFQAGASHFGISDLEVFVKDTHKFESRYLETLVGPFPARRDLYYARSPIHFTDRLSCPLIVFQGLEDKVVPPNQAELMVAALRAKKLPVAYLAFAGEQHGFRRAENIKRTLDAELYFYGKVFGFELADPVEPVVIENL